MSLETVAAAADKLLLTRILHCRVVELKHAPPLLLGAAPLLLLLSTAGSPLSSARPTTTYLQRAVCLPPVTLGLHIARSHLDVVLCQQKTDREELLDLSSNLVQQNTSRTFSAKANSIG